MFRSRFFAGVLTLALVAPAAVSAQVDTGSANFTRYVAVGDSLTAGFSSAGLVRTVQINSYPALIHRQATGQSTGFEQPLVSEPGIPGLLQLQSLAPLVIAPAAGRGQPLNLNLQRPYDNLAVPGADVHDAVATVTDDGGLHDLILRRIGTQLQQAVIRQPTFVTVWIGNNDVLGAATSGRVIEDVTLTSVARFEADFRLLVETLAGTGARMAIANIPNVTSIPYVTTVPAVVVNPATSQPVLVNGNVVPLIGPEGQLRPGQDFVLLTATAELSQGRGIPAQLGGSGQPLSDAAVLSASEVSAINARVQAFNSIIRSVAQQVGAAHVDINALMNELAVEGINIGGITLTETFLTGGVFSYDGVHPTPFGYAYVANAFIEAINDRFDGEIPLVDLYPFLFGPVASPVPASSSTDFVFAPAAARNLRWALGVPEDSVLNGSKPTRKPNRLRRPTGN